MDPSSTRLVCYMAVEELSAYVTLAISTSGLQRVEGEYVGWVKTLRKICV